VVVATPVVVVAEVTMVAVVVVGVVVEGTSGVVSSSPEFEPDPLSSSDVEEVMEEVVEVVKVSEVCVTVVVVVVETDGGGDGAEVGPKVSTAHSQSRPAYPTSQRQNLPSRSADSTPKSMQTPPFAHGNATQGDTLCDVVVVGSVEDPVGVGRVTVAVGVGVGRGAVVSDGSVASAVGVIITSAVVVGDVESVKKIVLKMVTSQNCPVNPDGHMHWSSGGGAVAVTVAVAVVSVVCDVGNVDTDGGTTVCEPLEDVRDDEVVVAVVEIGGTTVLEAVVTGWLVDSILVVVVAVTGTVGEDGVVEPMLSLLVSVVMVVVVDVSMVAVLLWSTVVITGRAVAVVVVVAAINPTSTTVASVDVNVRNAPPVSTKTSIELFRISDATLSAINVSRRSPRKLKETTMDPADTAVSKSA
jgi:hypothetical protein